MDNNTTVTWAPRVLGHPGQQEDSDVVQEIQGNIDSGIIHRMSSYYNKGDTLVIVNFNGTDKDCSGKPFESQMFVMESADLEKSPHLRNMMSARQQRKVRRLTRDGIAGQKIDMFSYILDLSIELSMDDDSLNVSGLFLSEGLKNWWKTALMIGVPRHTALGHDDACRCTKVSLLLEVTAEEEYIKGQALAPQWRRIDDYCETRNRANLLRLLRLLPEKDSGLMVNSAPRAFILTALAKLLGLESIVRDDVCSWFMAHPNSAIIELLPEETFQMAHTLQLKDIARQSFSIIVNELAIDMAADSPAGFFKKPKTTIFGRKRYDMGDDLDNVVQHAATSYAERARNISTLLLSDEIFDTLGIREWRKLSAILEALPEAGVPGDHPLITCITELRQGLGRGVRQGVYQALGVFPPQFTQGTLDSVQAKYPSSDKTHTFHYELLNDAQKALLPSFWSNLRARTVWDLERTFSPQGKLVSTLTSKHNKLIMDVLQSEQYGVKFAQTLLNYRDIFNIVSGGIDVKFDMMKFHDQLEDKLMLLKLQWGSDASRAAIAPQFVHDLLPLALNDSEYNFLPLWADGCDDGTGGVFASDVGVADMGANGPGPAYHTGLTLPSVAFGDEADRTETASVSTVNPIDANFGGLALSEGPGSTIDRMDANLAVLDVEDRSMDANASTEKMSGDTDTRYTPSSTTNSAYTPDEDSDGDSDGTFGSWQFEDDQI